MSLFCSHPNRGSPELFFLPYPKVPFVSLSRSPPRQPRILSSSDSLFQLLSPIFRPPRSKICLPQPSFVLFPCRHRRHRDTSISVGVLRQISGLPGPTPSRARSPTPLKALRHG